MTHGASLPTRQRLYGVAAALVTMAIWASWIVGTRAAVTGPGYFSPAMLAVIRFGFAAVLLAPVLWKMRMIPRGPRWPVLIGLLTAGSPYIIIVGAGMKYAPIADVAPLLPGTMPLIVAVLSMLLFRERFAPQRIAGLVLIALGVVLIVGGGAEVSTGGGTDLLKGHLLILCGASCWAVYTISLRASGLTGLQATAYVAFWSLVLEVVFLGAHLPADFARAAQAPIGQWVAQILIQGVLAGFVALLAYAAAVRRLGASVTAAITGLTPVAAIIAGIPVLGEVPTAQQWVACLGIVAGVALVTGAIGARRAAAAPRS